MPRHGGERVPGTAKRILPHPTLLIRTWPSTTVAIGRPFIFHPWYGQLRLLLRRRRRVLRSNANLVEIDLLRGGERVQDTVCPDQQARVFGSLRRKAEVGRVSK